MLKKKNPGKKRNLLYYKFLGRLIKKGKITKAKKILDTALFKTSKNLKISNNFVLYKIFFHLNSFVELKRVKKKKQINMVPFPISFSRRIYLALKWLLLSVKLNKARISFTTKLSIEFNKLVKGIPSNALKLKLLNNSQAYKYKSNAHFRW